MQSAHAHQPPTSRDPWANVAWLTQNRISDEASSAVAPHTGSKHATRCRNWAPAAAILVDLAPEYGPDAWGVFWGGPPLLYVRPAPLAIMPYLGDIVMADKSSSLESLRYAARLSRYLLIDASRAGNAARFINHSCSPNCVLVTYYDEYGMRGLMVVLLRDARVAPGDELTINYGWNAQPAQGVDVICRCSSRIAPHSIFRPPPAPAIDEIADEIIHFTNRWSWAWTNESCATAQAWLETATAACEYRLQRYRRIAASVDAERGSQQQGGGRNLRQLAQVATMEPRVAAVMPPATPTEVGKGRRDEGEEEGAEEETEVEEEEEYATGATPRKRKRQRRGTVSSTREGASARASGSASTTKMTRVQQQAAERATRASAIISEKWLVVQQVTFKELPNRVFWKRPAVVLHKSERSVVFTLYDSPPGDDETAGDRTPTPSAVLKLVTSRDAAANEIDVYTSKLDGLIPSVLPNTPRLLATGLPQGWPASRRIANGLLLEWAGESVNQIIKQPPPTIRFDPTLLRSVAFQLMWSLACLHDGGILHCDLHDNNICLRPYTHRAVYWWGQQLWSFTTTVRLAVIDYGNARYQTSSTQSITHDALRAVDVLKRLAPICSVAQADADFNGFAHRLHKRGVAVTPQSIVRDRYFAPLTTPQSIVEALQHTDVDPVTVAASPHGCVLREYQGLPSRPLSSPVRAGAPPIPATTPPSGLPPNLRCPSCRFGNVTPGQTKCWLCLSKAAI